MSVEKRIYQSDFRLGILGGGQLGRMLIQQAIDLDIRTVVLDPSPDAPCAAIANQFVLGDFNDEETVYRFGQLCDVITIEIEHVNVKALERLSAEGKVVFPKPDVLKVVQDKGLQKQFYRLNKIPTAPFHMVENKNQIQQFESEFPFVQKLRKGGYDGRGVQVLNSIEDLHLAFDAPSVLEKLVDIDKEISVIVGRNEAGDTKCFPIAELQFNPTANLVEFLFSPAQLEPDVAETAVKIATQIVQAFKFTGILAVEMFVTRQGEVLVNEIAPRPHNSGHHTIEANITSQYGQHLRSILGLPLGDTAVVVPSVMVNLLGEQGYTGPVVYRGLEEVLKWPGVYVHLYGKSETRPFRKMGHVTCCNQSLEGAKSLAKRVKQTLKVVSE